MVFLFLIIGCIIFLIIFFTIISPKRNNYDATTRTTHYYEVSNNSTSSPPKITATVSTDFHAEVQRYCQTQKTAASALLPHGWQSFSFFSPSLSYDRCNIVFITPLSALPFQFPAYLLKLLCKFWQELSNFCLMFQELSLLPPCRKKTFLF